MDAGVAAAALAAAAHAQATARCGSESALALAWETCGLQPFLQQRLWPFPSAAARPLACFAAPLEVGSEGAFSGGGGGSSGRKSVSAPSAENGPLDASKPPKRGVDAKATFGGGRRSSAGRSGAAALTASGGGGACHELDLDVPCAMLEALTSLRLHAPLFASIARPAVRAALLRGGFAQPSRRSFATATCFNALGFN